jgi:hypothetical protein
MGDPLRLTRILRLILSAPMIRPGYIIISIAFAAGLLACGGDPVGRICDLGTSTPGPSEVVVASPSLDCVTRTCLRQPLQRELPQGSVFPEGANGLCTTFCESDDDCERVPESPCVTGFACGIAIQVGPFCCRKVCICKDYIVVPEGGLTTPEACKPEVASNMCCNLDGRVGNAAQYPACN